MTTVSLGAERRVIDRMHGNTERLGKCALLISQMVRQGIKLALRNLDPLCIRAVLVNANQLPLDANIGASCAALHAFAAGENGMDNHAIPNLMLGDSAADRLYAACKFMAHHNASEAAACRAGIAVHI
jgi:hypothetical protein